MSLSIDERFIFSRLKLAITSCSLLFIASCTGSPTPPVSSSSSVSSLVSVSSAAIPPSSAAAVSSSASDEFSLGKMLYQDQCAGCHELPTTINLSQSYSRLVSYTAATMPKSDPSLCDTACAESMFDYLYNDAGLLSASSSSVSPVIVKEPNPNFVPLFAVNSGGSGANVDGQAYEADRYFTGGDLGGTGDGIANTNADVLYQSERWGAFSYSFPVKAGTYDITLHMGEFFWEEGGARIFNVEVEGDVLINGFDPFSSAGHDSAYIVHLNGISVSDGQLDLNFSASVDNANVAAIVIKGLAGSANIPEPASCGNGSYRLCLDFEDVAVGGIPSGFNRQGNIQVVENQEAHSGTRSLRFDASERYTHRIQSNNGSFAGKHWGRIFYKLRTPTPIPTDMNSDFPVVHTTFVELQHRDFYARVVDTVEHSSRSLQYLFNVQMAGVSNEDGMGTNYDFRFEDRWVCTEWSIDNTTQTFDLYVDGNHISGASGRVNFGLPAPWGGLPDQWDSIAFGLSFYQESTASWVGWIDDAAISSTRIGCD